MTAATIGLVGFGEAAQAFVRGWQRSGQPILAYDLKLEAGSGGRDLHEACRALGIVPARADALSGVGLIFCLVTADQAVAAAEALAPHLRAGTLWLDGNSCSPGAKRNAAALIEAAGACYVDLAVMAPVFPKLHRTPLLISGPHSAAALVHLEALDMAASIAGSKVGDASATKMMRSIIIKGLEALTAEAFLAARKAGVEEAVIASLQASDSGINWATRGAYNLERMLVHGGRRAAEMAEVAATLRELGLPDRMAQATMEWQAQLAALGLEPGSDELGARADLILAGLE